MGIPAAVSFSFLLFCIHLARSHGVGLLFTFARPQVTLDFSEWENHHCYPEVVRSTTCLLFWCLSSRSCLRGYQFLPQPRNICSGHKACVMTKSNTGEAKKGAYLFYMVVRTSSFVLKRGKPQTHCRGIPESKRGSDSVNHYPEGGFYPFFHTLCDAYR